MIDFNFTRKRLPSPFHPYRVEIDIKTKQQHVILGYIIKHARAAYLDGGDGAFTKTEGEEMVELLNRMVDVIKAPLGG